MERIILSSWTGHFSSNTGHNQDTLSKWVYSFTTMLITFCNLKGLSQMEKFVPFHWYKLSLIYICVCVCQSWSLRSIGSWKQFIIKEFLAYDKNWKLSWVKALKLWLAYWLPTLPKWFQSHQINRIVLSLTRY